MKTKLLTVSFGERNLWVLTKHEDLATTQMKLFRID
jgi:hypothetical protein